jgi:hypothetical protein
MLPLKAYVIGVPFVLALWKMAFQEADPRGWDMRDAGIYNGLLAEIFKTLELGYLLCVAGLVIAVIAGSRLHDVKVVRAGLGYGLVSLFCLLLTHRF